VLAGKIIGRAAVYDGKRVVQTQSYGAEARGSAAKSEVIIADERIGFPMVRKCDVLVAMSQTALERYIKDLKEGGTLLVDESMVREVPEIKARVFTVPATKVAETELKTRICANTIMLGALVTATGIVSQKADRLRTSHKKATFLTKFNNRLRFDAYKMLIRISALTNYLPW